MPIKTDPTTGAYPTPLHGETAEVAGLRLKQEADLFRTRQKAEKEAVAARAAKAEADAIAVAAAEAEDNERGLVGIWRPRFHEAGPSVNERSVIDARARELGIPLAALVDEAGNNYGNAAAIDNLWAARSEAQAAQVARELAATRAAALERAADRQLEYEANLASQLKMEK